MKKQNTYYIAKIVVASSMNDALRKEKTVQPFDIRQTTKTQNSEHVSLIGFAAEPPEYD